jgi:hypothetical protein
MFGRPKECAGCRALTEDVAWLRAQNENLTKLLAEDRKPGVLRRVEPPKPHDAPLPPRLANTPRKVVPIAPGYEPFPPREEEVEIS